MQEYAGRAVRVMKRQHARRSDGMKGTYRRAGALSWMFSIFVALAVLIFLFLIWFTPLRISGDTMSPALEDGEIVLVDRLARYWKLPERGDLVCFTDAYGTFVKRVVGLPGETVDIKDGRVYIDSRPLDESAYASGLTGDMDAVTVPEGSVFLLGDCRALVYDSRLPEVGCIPYAELTGVLRARVYPFLRFTVFF